MAIYDVSGNELLIPEVPFANVVDFGAKGNGTDDDASAIQAAIDSVNTGGVVYFPHGIYLVSESVKFYSNQTLYFEEGATILQGGSINNLLRTYCDSTITGYNGVHDSIIYGGTFDGGAYTTNNTLVGTAHSKNIIFEKCTFKNAYGAWHNLEINSSYNIKIIDCDFEGSRKTGENGEMIQIDGAVNSSAYPWDNIQADNTISKYIDICGCFFHNSSIAPGIGNHSYMAHKFAKVHDCVFDSITSSRGAINFVPTMTDIDIYGNTFNNCTKGIGSSGTTYYIHDNRFVGATIAYAGTDSVVHANMINGSYAS